jgi:hypothetical protein
MNIDMKNKFDFDDIGKTMPYLTPDHFFEEMQDKIVGEIGYKKHRRRRITAITIAAIATAAIIAICIFLPVNKDIETDAKTITTLATNVQKGISTTDRQRAATIQTKDKTPQTGQVAEEIQKKNIEKPSDDIENDADWIEGLSDEDLNELTATYDNDILII